MEQFIFVRIGDNETTQQKEKVDGQVRVWELQRRIGELRDVKQEHCEGRDSA
jgi:hypothetical protein